MTSKTNHWKLGLFVVTGIVGSIAAVFWIGAQRLNREVVDAVTYFDESVQGLDLGAPIQVRGVTVGNVLRITIAPDRRLVEVHMRLHVDSLTRLGLYPPPPGAVTEGRLGPSDLRVQLSTTGITGVKFINADFFPGAAPPPVLDFQPPAGYVPSFPSTLKSLETGVTDLMAELPGALDEFRALARTANRKVEQLELGALSERLASLLERLDGLVAQVDADEVDGLVGEATATLEALRTLVEDVQRGEGPIASALDGLERLAREAEATLVDVDAEETGRSLRAALDAVRVAAGAVGALARDASGLTALLEADLLALRDALAALQSLAVMLERDPGSLLHGRATPAAHPLEESR